MGYDERLFERMLDALERKEGWSEKNQFGGRVCVVKGRPFIGAVDGAAEAVGDDQHRIVGFALRACPGVPGMPRDASPTT